MLAARLLSPADDAGKVGRSDVTMGAGAEAAAALAASVEAGASRVYLADRWGCATGSDWSTLYR